MKPLAMSVRVLLTLALVGAGLLVGIVFAPGLVRGRASAPPGSGTGTRSPVVLFEMPTTDHFRRQLLPGAGDAEAPAPDIPLYPDSDCQTQVGHGGDYFVGFYTTPDSVEAIRSYYVRVLTQLGWLRMTGNERPNLKDRSLDRGHSVLETFAKPDEDRMTIIQLTPQDSAPTRIGMVAFNSGSPNADPKPGLDPRK